MANEGRTGIQITPGISDAQKQTAHLIHALHLDWFGSAIAALGKGTTMTITVDGQTREEPWAGTHFVELPPGVHPLALSWNTHSMGGRSIRPFKQDITVEPGRVTELVYTIQNSVTHGLAAASLEVKGVRPA